MTWNGHIADLAVTLCGPGMRLIWRVLSLASLKNSFGDTIRSQIAYYAQKVGAAKGKTHCMCLNRMLLQLYVLLHMQHIFLCDRI